jgi:ribokinase
MSGRRSGDRRVVVVGSAMVDLITCVDRIPRAGETLFASEFSRGYGGKGANQAAAVALHGVTSSMVGCVGDDFFGSATIEDLEAFGVDVTHVATIPGEATGTAVILVERSGENRIALGAGANRCVDAGFVARALRELESRGGVRPVVVMSQLEIAQEAATTAFQWARERGATTVMTPGPIAAFSPQLLRLCDWLVPNETELMGLLGLPPDHPIEEALTSASSFASDLGVCLAVTVGAQGAVLVAAGSTTRVPAPPVQAQDTTGAGDAFAGSFAAALAGGSAPLLAARAAVTFASDSVTRSGTRRSYRRVGGLPAPS